MPRFYIDPPAGDFITLTGEDARHICRSLRMAVGEALTLCDGAGIDYNGVLRQTDGQIATVEILSRQPSQTEPTVSIRLFQALPKGDKMEWIIQKAVELGISEVVPVLTERCISRPDEKSMEKKLLRWQKIAVEAAKQCGRSRIPTVCPLMSFSQAVQRWVPWKRDCFFTKRRPAFKKALCAPAAQIGIFVGAEGGFSSEEAHLAQEVGATCTSLGNRILRCETAPLAALSAILYETDNF